MRRLENAGALMEKEAIDDFNSRMMNVEISDIAKETYKELGPQITDLVHDMRDASLGVSMELHGSNPVDWTVLKNQVTEKRVRYVTFLKAAQEVGLTEQQARTVWFSPKARSRL